MKEIILGIWLGIEGGIDFAYKEIPLWLSAVGGSLGIIFCIAEERNVLTVAIACLPGIIFLGLAKVTKEVIGYGDGVILLVMGFYLPLQRILSVGMLAFLLAGIVALVLLVVFHKKGSYQIPFLPFLAAAYVVDWISSFGGANI